MKRRSKLASKLAHKLGSDPGFWGWHSCDRGVSRLRRALLSSCFAKKKVSKEEGDPGRRPAARGPLRYSVWAGAAELAATRLKQSSPFIRPTLRCSASHKGPGKASRHNLRIYELLYLVSPCCWGRLSTGWFSPSRRQRRATEALAEKGRGLFEGRSPEFRSPRQRRVAQGTLRSRALTPGRLFFAYFLLAKQKKVRRAASAKPHGRTSAKPKYRGLSPV